MNHRSQYFAAAAFSLLNLASITNEAHAQEVITIERANALITPFYQALTTTSPDQIAT